MELPSISAIPNRCLFDACGDAVGSAAPAAVDRAPATCAASASAAHCPPTGDKSSEVEPAAGKASKQAVGEERATVKIRTGFNLQDLTMKELRKRIKEIEKQLRGGKKKSDLDEGERGLLMEELEAIEAELAER
eukprot:TRINITY_DN64080_c0_g1_i1.p2 TRINITY_DN64080_c0_g1~~TRINITY_DN64080_c0_g1_i1.p2  ORF type:complete len:134 (-),score=41.94 TRINITY_DN64080_c0_g1_i1:75-476(-)